MKIVDDTVVDCVQQLLPNLAASGIWGSLAAFGHPGTIPLAAGLGCVAAYLGLVRLRVPASEEEARKDLIASIETIRNRTWNADRQLEGLGFQLQYSIEDVHRRLTALDQMVAEISAKLEERSSRLDEAVRSYLRTHTDRLDDLLFFVQVNFDALQPFISDLPRKVGHLSEVQNEVRNSALRTEDKVDRLLQMMTMDQQRLRAENERRRADVTSVEPDNIAIRESSRDALRSVLAAAETGDAESSQAIADYLRDRDLDRFKTFFDKYALAADEVADRAATESLERHRKRASLMYTIGDLNRAEESFRRILTQRPKDPNAIAGVASIFSTRGLLKDAEEMYRLLLDSSDGCPRSASTAYTGLGLLLHLRGKFAEAAAMHSRALEINEILGNASGVATNLGNFGIVKLVRGDLDGAEMMFTESLEMFKSIGGSEGMANQYGNLGAVLFQRGEYHGAEQALLRSLELNQGLGKIAGMASQYGNLGNVYDELGDYDLAESMYRKSLQINEELGRRHYVAMDLGNIGIILQRRGKLEAAEEMHRAALIIDQELERPEGVANHFGNLGILLRERGDLGGAERMHRQALEINRKLGLVIGMAGDYRDLGMVEKDRGSPLTAREFFVQARDLFAKLGLRERVNSIQAEIDEVSQCGGSCNAPGSPRGSKDKEGDSH